ncbi:MAG: hypothetical protein IKS44_08110 [Bacteroidales bacterium]|nr:hypothetical protein [Bacteroidales bacterium]
MGKTMQQIDHDAWEEGYGRNSGEVNQECNDLTLKAMYEELARRKAEKEGVKEEPPKELTQEEKDEKWEKVMDSLSWVDEDYKP